MKTIVALLIVSALTAMAQEPQTVQPGTHSVAEAATALPASSVPISIEDDQQKSMSRIFGTVIDYQTREPIANAKVMILGTNLSGQSSVDGQYKIESVPEGIFQIKAEAPGYEAQIMNNVQFDGVKSVERLFFALNKTSQKRGDVIGGQEPPPDFLPVDKQPVPLKDQMPAPVYPVKARRAGIEGTVWVKVWVDEQGNGRKLQVIKTDNEIFNQAAVDAAIQWKFKPAILNDKPVAVWVSIPFKFKLEEGKKSDMKKVEPKSTTKPGTR